MDSRKHNLLKAIVEEYIKTAAPVGSTLIAEKYFPDLSSATIRNEMAQLEDEGMIFQPHTSAGRMPTGAGLKEYASELELSSDLNETIAGLWSEKIDSREDLKSLAKSVAESSGDAVIVAFGPLDVYYTGLSNLFSQPEFNNFKLVCSMSQVIDGLDKAIAKNFHQIDQEIKILIGEDNPFGDMASTVMFKTSFNSSEIVMGILGLLRMDYKKNISLAKQANKLINNNLAD
ncbi:MAG: Heat-inducible transcription repressor HrcA [Parcubacteria group bacterium ADurb.Bin326]|nr:MAG: Heat-inducible transcription repressor HrcA [Parcubacteria group bacterium ADurb.Bin326]